MDYCNVVQTAKGKLLDALTGQEWYLGARVATDKHGMTVAMQRVDDMFDSFVGVYETPLKAWEAFGTLHRIPGKLSAFEHKANLKRFSKRRARLDSKHAATVDNISSSATAAGSIEPPTEAMRAMTLDSKAKLAEQYAALAAEEAAYIKRWEEKQRTDKIHEELHLAAPPITNGGSEAVHKDVEYLLSQEPGGSSASPTQAKSASQQQATAEDDEDSDGPGDGGGFD